MHSRTIHAVKPTDTLNVKIIFLHTIFRNSDMFRYTLVILRDWFNISVAIWYAVFVNCNWVATWWQQYNTHLHTHTIHRTTQNKQYIKKHKKFGRVCAVPRLWGFYHGICLTTEEKARKNFRQGSRRVPTGTKKIHKHKIRIRRLACKYKRNEVSKDTACRVD